MAINIKSKSSNQSLALFPKLQKQGIVSKEFIFNPSSNVKYSQGKHNITMSSRNEEETILLDKKQLSFTKSGRILHPEFLPYFMTMKDGCAKKLLLYILFHELDIPTMTFRFDTHLINQFNKYCSMVDGTEYKHKVVKQVIRDIVAANLTISLKRSLYMINPLIISMPSKSRWQLINKYITALIDKDKEVDANFFPRFTNANKVK